MNVREKISRAQELFKLYDDLSELIGLSGDNSQSLVLVAGYFSFGVGLDTNLREKINEVLVQEKYRIRKELDTLIAPLEE